MAKTAAELADLIVELEAKDKLRACDVLRAKCVAEIENMVRNREYDCLVEVSDGEVIALERVTEELRDLGYKFRFIERQKSNGDSIDFKLLISIHHCK